jgi:mannose-6-phosphate isomerase-like protein (cupin superfamily)
MIDFGNIQDFFPRMVGADETCFFSSVWRKRTQLWQGVLPSLRGAYDCASFLDDYERTAYHGATTVIEVEDGKRLMLPFHSADALSGALRRGASLTLSALALPDDLPNMPAPWAWFRGLYYALCDYLLPEFPARWRFGGPVAAVDVFCTGRDASIGGHYDTGDVFYFVLEGEKEWTVELVPDDELGHALALEGTNYTLDRAPRREHTTLVVKPGDCLYVPPYTYHRVRSRGASLAVSIGLPTFTEVTFLRWMLSNLEKERGCCEPLPTFPRTQAELHRRAAKSARVRIDAMLSALR